MSENAKRIVNEFTIPCYGKWASIALPKDANILYAEQPCLPPEKLGVLRICVESDVDQGIAQRFDFIIVKTGKEFEAKEGMIFLRTFDVCIEMHGSVPVYGLHHVYYCKGQILDGVPFGTIDTN